MSFGLLLGALGALGALAVFSKGKGGASGGAGAGGSAGAGTRGATVGRGPTTFPKPLAVGYRGDPEIDALHAEMSAVFHEQGVDLEIVKPWDVTVMVKTPGNAHAIPPRELWPRMAQTLREIYQPLYYRMVDELGIPIRIQNGYRPTDYNAAVGGAPGSRHQAFEALDVYVKASHSSLENRQTLALEGARVYLDADPELEMGFGVYAPDEAPDRPSNIHVDSGWDRRSYEEGPYWVERAEAERPIAVGGFPQGGPPPYPMPGVIVAPPPKPKPDDGVRPRSGDVTVVRDMATLQRLQFDHACSVRAIVRDDSMIGSLVGAELPHRVPVFVLVDPNLPTEWHVLVVLVAHPGFHRDDAAWGTSAIDVRTIAYGAGARAARRAVRKAERSCLALPGGVA